MSRVRHRTIGCGPIGQAGKLLGWTLAYPNMQTCATTMQVRKLAAGMTSIVILFVLAAWITSFFVAITCQGRSSDDDQLQYGVRFTRGSLVFAERRYIDIGSNIPLSWGFDPVRWRPLPLDFHENVSFLVSDISRSGHGDDFIRKPVTHWSSGGFAYQTSSTLEFKAKWHYAPNTPSPVSHPTDSWALVIPMWPIVVPAVIIEAEIIRRWLLRYWRKSNGLCPKCGFDLRATPDRCPECGAEQPLGATSPKPANS
jgi:hypothetical protein